jgi:hypothetical protein
MEIFPVEYIPPPLHEAGITKYEIHLMSSSELTLILSLRNKGGV